MATKVVTHWTREGTFKIEWIFLGGSMHYRLWHNDTDLGVYSYPMTAAESIGDGKHDQMLGFAASKLGVPSSFEEWNGLR